MENISFQKTNALEILKARFDSLYTRDDQLDQKAQHCIEAMSIFIALAGAFGTFGRAHDPTDQILIASIFFIYGATLYLAFYAMLPKRWFVPVDPDDLPYLIDKDEDTYFETALYSYIESVNSNEASLDLKAVAVRRTIALSFFTFLLIAILIAR